LFFDSLFGCWIYVPSGRRPILYVAPGISFGRELVIPPTLFRSVTHPVLDESERPLSFQRSATSRYLGTRNSIRSEPCPNDLFRNLWLPDARDPNLPWLMARAK